jgi:Cys-rich repeat protein
MRAIFSVVAAYVAVACIASCASSPVGARRDSGGLDGSGSGHDAGSIACTSDGECAAGQRCSVVSHACIGADECVASADCATGTTCGAGSHRCFATGACAADGDCPAGQVCDEATSTCMIGGMCGTSEFAIERLPPNVMILLDRSGSMDGTIGGVTRWDIAKSAIQRITRAFDMEIRFGLATYSSCLSGGCSAGRVVVPIADINAGFVNEFLAPLLGRGSSSGTAPNYLCDSGDPETSTGASLAALVGEPSLQDASRRNYVLLITDGGESGSCTPPDGTMGATMLFEQPVSVGTFAVGFSADTNPDQLRAIAAAGGTGDFYQADDSAMLEAALDSIAAAVVGCDFHVDTAPPDPSMLYVYFNNDPTALPVGADGWTYDAATQTLTFEGAACDMLQAGSVSDVDVVYGCPGPTVD